MHRACPFLLLLAVLLCACTCGSRLPPPHFVSEEPVGSGSWVEVDALPDWVVAPPVREGHLPFVASAKSNLRRIVTIAGQPSAEKDAQKHVFSALEPVVGVDSATAAVTRVPAAMRMVDRACKEELLTRDMVPGNTLCTAWALWELDVEVVLAGIDADRRDEARAALAE